MATPNFEQIKSFNHVVSQLRQAAIDEFISELYEGITQEEVVEQAVRIAEKYDFLGAELGAQWYDLCTEIAGINADPAELAIADIDGIQTRAQGAMARADKSVMEDVFASFFENEINRSIRMTGDANLYRDYERGIAGGKWARVPVGETCAWCLMLASQGAWYLSEKSALGESAGHYHDGCDCVAVYHADPESIKGYADLLRYKNMYYEADNMRKANKSGMTPYPEELQQRIDSAKAAHLAREKESKERGETISEWTKYNEDMIVMRYKFALK